MREPTAGEVLRALEKAVDTFNAHHTVLELLVKDITALKERIDTLEQRVEALQPYWEGDSD